jgi:hypothetical protein
VTTVNSSSEFAMLTINIEEHARTLAEKYEGLITSVTSKDFATLARLIEALAFREIKGHEEDTGR